MTTTGCGTRWSGWSASRPTTWPSTPTNSLNERARTGDPGVDEPPPGPWVWERKYELDSLCYPVRLAHRLWRRTGTTDHLDDATLAMLRTVVDTMTIEQDHDASSGYWFGRGVPASDTLPHDGKGSPVARTGMVWSGFRPSDDACAFHYLVPANMFAVVSLAQLAEIVTEVYADIELADRASTLAGQIRIGIDEHAVIEHPVHASIWAYEVDGLGNRLLADDANTPSLLSAPYLGYCAPDDPVYLATRAFVLSAENPYYFSGSAASGLGSPHTPDRYIWPMGLAMVGLTSTDRAEQDALLETLPATTAGTG